MTGQEYLSLFLNLVLCAYMTNSDHKVKRLAQKYYKQCSKRQDKATMKMIFKSRFPCQTVKLAYDKLTG